MTTRPAAVVATLLFLLEAAACGGGGGGEPAVPTAPGAPTGVTATPGIRSAQVSWAAPATDGGSPILDFTVTSTPNGGTVTVTGLSATVSGLADGTAYGFAVAARNAAGTGPASARSAAVTTPDVPAAPDVTALPGDRSASVSWSAPAVNGPPVTGYDLTVTPPRAGALVRVSGRSASVAGLDNGTAYTFAVTATNAVGRGPAGRSAAATPRLAPCPSCAAGALSGQAAAGAPVLSGTLALLAADGGQAIGTMASDGTYRVDVGALAGPYLVKVAGTVGGRPVVLHSIATASDVASRVVHVTTFTELLSALVLGGDPEAAFSGGAPGLAALAAVTDLDLLAASDLLAGRLSALLAATGAAGLDLRTAPFAVDGTGLDLALDAVSLTSAVDAGSGAITYRLASKVSGAVLAFDPASPAGAELPFTAADLAALQAAQASLGGVGATLAGLTALFATALPAADAVAPYLAGGFRHDGLDAAAFTANVLLAPRTAPDGFDLVGLAVGGLTLERAISADALDVTFGLEVGARGAGGTVRYPPWSEPMRVTRVGGAWKLAGNGRPGAVKVTQMARLKELPLTQAQVAALPGVGTFTSPPAPASIAGAYYLLLPDVPAPGLNTAAWIGFAGRDPAFGTIAYAGDVFDAPGTPSWNERVVRRQSSRYLATPTGRASTYLVLEVSSLRLDPAVARVVVTGPGLPAGGLTLVRAPATIPREYLIFAGDSFTWNAFNSERCAQVAPANPSCALDWTKVASGSVFHFDFQDGIGASLGTVDEPIRGRPLDEAAWWARRTDFPRFTNSAGMEPTLARVYDDTPGSPWGDGGAPTATWEPPGDAAVRLTMVSFNRNYWLGNSSANPDDLRKEGASYSLWGRTAPGGGPLTSLSHTFQSTGWLSEWGWATIEARDVFGNALQHEVSPTNPR